MARTNARVQNAAFQFQDLAVQIQGGVNPSKALAQQIPQLLGGFGALGAVSGLVAGLAFGLAGPLVDGLFESTDGAKGLDKALEELEDTIRIAKDGTILLSEEFEILAGKSREVAEVQLKARLITATNAANAAFGLLSDSVSELNVGLDKSGNAARGNQKRWERLADQYGVTTGELKELRSLIDTAVSSKSVEDVAAMRQRITELALSSGSTTEKFTQLAQAVNEASAQFKQQREIINFLSDASNNAEAAAAKYGETAVKSALEASKALEKQAAAIAKAQERQEALALSSLMRAGQSALRSQESAGGSLDALKRELASREELIQMDAQRRLDIVQLNREKLLISAQTQADLEIKIEKKKQEELKALEQKGADDKNKYRTAELTAAGSFLTLMGSLSDAENKKQFDKNKNLRITGATMSGIASTVEAYRSGSEVNPFVAATYAALAAATTGAQIAQIESQQYPGRAIGGQVMAGQPYRVGEYGAETFVPNSAGKIIPGDQITNNYNASNDDMPPITIQIVEAQDRVQSVTFEDRVAKVVMSDLQSNGDIAQSGERFFNWRRQGL